MNNKPYSVYCNHTIYYSEINKNFYYRSSPFQLNSYYEVNSGGEFIGKNNYYQDGDKDWGNEKFLQSPTTIIDLGPKTNFLQEITFSTDKDGYIIGSVNATSYKDISEILNLFVLSRLVNTNFWGQLIPISGDPNEGSDDPSVGAFFSNSRWRTSGDGLIPGFIDGDYSQMISINSEFGITEFGSDTYGSDAVFFGENYISSSDQYFPYFGIFLTGDTQNRDYISPRRTLWNINASYPLPTTQTLLDCYFTYIPVKTQEIPFYQWGLDYLGQPLSNQTTIFGSQSNNWVTTIPFKSEQYQKLDRINPNQYFRADGSDTINFRGTLLNFDNNFEPTSNIPQSSVFTEKFLVGGPHFFYFGLKKGASAMDIFIKKYVITEVNE